MIKTTLIAHASMLIQSKETTILTDPVWFDYLWEEVNVLCPTIDLSINQIPPVDILYISHRHQDHCDVRTLAFLKKNKTILKKNATVLVPNDSIIIDILKELEYKNVRIVANFEPIELNDVTLTPTPSLNEGDNFPEHGLLVHDGEVTIWNQVDTIVNPEIISYIHKLYGQIDFAHSRFLPLLEGSFTHHKSVNLPFEEYSSYLKVITALRPKFVVPGSAAFRYRNELSFMNQYSFPTTQEQYLSDLSVFCPDIESCSFYSGDVALISKDNIKIEKQSSNFIRVLEDDSYKIVFKPVMEVPPIRSLTDNIGQHQKELSIITKYIESQFIEKIIASDMTDGWRHWQTLYQLEIFGPDGNSDIWSIDFNDQDLKIIKGTLNKINLYEGIAVSDLIKLIEGNTSWDYVGISGNYRTFNNVYRVGAGIFESFPNEKTFPLPLLKVFPRDNKMDKDKYMREVYRWKELS